MTLWHPTLKHLDNYLRTLGVPSNELDSILPSLDDRLSSEARILLKAAVSADGQILCVLVMGGMIIQIGGRNYTEGADARSQAMWEGAIGELEKMGLLLSLGDKREIFKVTREGYDAADRITD